MDFDAEVARTLLRNAAIRNAQGWSTAYDLQGARASVSDAPIAALNCLHDFTTTPRQIEPLLEIGFALLRAFDREPAAELTPLDRPKSVAQHLRARRLVRQSRRSWMLLHADAPAIETNPEVEVRIVAPDDVRAFAAIHAGSDRWVKKLSLASTSAALQDPRNTFYLGSIDDAAAGTLHLICDGDTAGIYAVGTLRAQRCRGVSSAMMAHAIRDARARGCSNIGLSTDYGGYAETLYARQGFERMFVSELWVARTPAG